MAENFHTKPIDTSAIILISLQREHASLLFQSWSTKSHPLPFNEDSKASGIKTNTRQKTQSPGSFLHHQNSKVLIQQHHNFDRYLKELGILCSWFSLPLCLPSNNCFFPFFFLPLSKIRIISEHAAVISHNTCPLLSAVGVQELLKTSIASTTTALLQSTYYEQLKASTPHHSNKPQTKAEADFPKHTSIWLTLNNFTLPKAFWTVFLSFGIVHHPSTWRLF